MATTGHDGAAGLTRPKLITPTEVSVLSTATGARVDVIGSSSVDRGDVAVTGVTLRGQDVLPGDLFAALPGASTHGARYAADALDRGATAILTDPAGRAELTRALPADAECAVLVHPEPRSVLGAVSARVYGNPTQRLKLVGITGTSGKTTTSYLVEAALLAGGRSVGLIGTVETRVNGEAQPSSLTTPEAPTLQALLAAMLEAGVDTVVMEVSSHALALGRVDGAHFAVGAFTNLSQDHLDFHPTMEAYFEAKAQLFAPGSPTRATRAVVCVDDHWGRQMAAIAAAPSDPQGPGSTPRSRSVTTVTTGQVARGPGEHWTAGPSTVADDGSQQVTLTDPAGTDHAMRLPLPGRYNVANATLAVAVAVAVGVDLEDATTAVSGVAVPGRLERIDRGQSFLAVVDYAHKPGAVEAVLTTLRSQARGRVGIVLGAGGDRDHAKRPLMGAAAALGADLLIVTDDNPRTEDPATIRAAILDGARAADGRAEIRDFDDRRVAIDEAIAWAEADDIVLVAGKGHEVGQDINGVKHRFDDREVVAAAVEARLVRERKAAKAAKKAAKEKAEQQKAAKTKSDDTQSGQGR